MDKLAEQFAELAKQYAPQVADAAKAAVVTEVYSTLMGSLMALGFAVASFVLGKVIWKADEDFKFLAIIPWLITAICAAIFVWNWIDPWTWTALNHPELWLAKRAFNL